MHVPLSHPPRRPPLKKAQILEELREWIIGGKLAPAGRLPTRRELSDTFQTSLITVQQALDQLVAEGFVEARGRHGTFVTDHPPHLSHYGLVFPSSPDSPNWPRWFTALSNEALRIQHTGDRKFQTYLRIDGHTDNADYQRLLRDIQHRRLAGILFASSPFLLHGSPILEAPGLPRVALMGGPSKYPQVTRVDLDVASFLHRALDYFVQRKRKRVAILTAQTPLTYFTTDVAAALAERKLITKPYWIHGMSRELAPAARHVVHLLLNAGQHVRPDALLITDDNLVEHATTGLVDAGLKVPDDIDVIAHCNFPWPTPAALPIRRLGYDAREVLRHCLEVIDIRRQGKPAKERLVSAIFEDELVPVSESQF